MQHRVKNYNAFTKHDNYLLIAGITPHNTTLSFLAHVYITWLYNAKKKEY